ncbi:MAG: serine/threonine protein kinase [Proteobacteria bacterium]|nr:serine/threonine protein kinase [Pseudomonadota bacterium]
MYHRAESDPFVGTLFDGRYLVQSLVACGGMGSIYKANDTRTGMIVALKMLRPDLSHDAVILHRFQLETSVVSRLKHPNICQLFDAGCVDGDKYYFTMEFLEGQPLDSILQQRRVLEPWVAIRYMHQVAAALCDAHMHGVIHRDLKPANIFIVQTAGTADFVKVIDFGVAKLDQDVQALQQKLTNAGATLGTPYYMSPEQIRGSDVDARTDIYALGIILWECLFGMPPYVGNSLIDIFEATLNHKLPKLPEHLKNERIWKRIYRVLDKALQKDKNKRYRSMAAFMRALEELLDGFVMTGEDYEVMRTHDSLPALNTPEILQWLHHISPGRLILVGTIVCICIGFIIARIVLWMPTEIEIPQTQLHTYKFISDVPAEVLINNRPLGNTPLTLDLPEKPPVLVYMKAPELPAQSFTLTEDVEDISGYAVNLSAKVVDDPYVYFETMPAGADVYVNGVLHSEKTPCKVSAIMTEHLHIKFKLEGYRTESIIVVNNGGDFKLRTNLFRKRSQ